MTSLPAGIAVEQALLRQAVAISVLKQSAEADKAIGNILEQAIQAVPASHRGANVNITA